MRRLFAAIAVTVVVVGCGRPLESKQEQDIKDQVLRYFHLLNNEMEEARLAAKTSPVPDLEAPEGRQFSEFSFHPAGVILENVECPRCKAKQIIVTYSGKAVQCSSCGSGNDNPAEAKALIAAGRSVEDLQNLFPERAKPMFELRKDKKLGKNKLAIIRYVRRQWTLDERGKIEFSEAFKRKDPEKAKTGQDAADVVTKNGLHRIDATFLCTTAFYYDGAITQVDPATVRKILDGEMPDLKTWKLGPTTSIEEPLRPWNSARSQDPGRMRSY